MLHRSSESVHIIWSMLFVAGALVLSYMLTFDRGYFLIGLGDVGEVVAEEIDGVVELVLVEETVNTVPEADIELQTAVVSLSQTLNTAQEEVVTLSDVLRSPPVVGQGTQVAFEAPDPVNVDDKQFFSVQQLFAEGSEEIVGGGVESTLGIKQGTLDLQNTYEWQNNGRFVLPELVGVGEEVEYILKDERNTHYVYLGDYTPLVLGSVEENSGSVVAIEDDLSINRRGFFGDRVWMISLPAYEARNKIVLLVVFESNDDTWLLQIDRDRFEGAGGEYLFESFAQHYIW